ncbi:MAG: hypothetical protein SOZ52_04810, partial [Pyramidobacter sp.]|nr:hypothetical protein [Pyramidobacter sp.]
MLMNILYSLNKLLGRVGLLSLAGAVALIIAHPCVLTCAAAAPVITCEAPSWLKRSVSGSMNAVWRELDATQLSDAAARDTLA